MNSSNIGIRSNIYIRKTDNYRNDPEYVKRITNKAFLREIKSQQFGTLRGGVKLSAVQEKILANQPCMLSRKEYSYGPVLRSGNLVWSCRCENIQCNRYEQCISADHAIRIVREKEIEEETDPERNLSSLGITISTSGALYTKKREHEEFIDDYIKADEPQATEEEISGYIRIGDPSELIQAGLNTHFLLNSAPGTGKTYTIIQRIIYLLDNRLCAPENIYILCYTRSAKKVILDKISEAISSGQLYDSAKDICLFTFDAFATLFLSTIEDELEKNLAGCDYNERISLFNEYFPKYSADVDYLIIDEIQDLVNERAEMVLQILRNVSCGYLLAGDKCQAIYDYEADKSASIDSSKFYHELESILLSDSRKYEIIGNRRQTEELAVVSNGMRELILTKPQGAAAAFVDGLLASFYQPNCVKEFIGRLSLSGAADTSTAILCRSNYNSEKINSILCQRRIPHELFRGVNSVRSLPRWIADIFWDYCESVMSKEVFFERYFYRSNFAENADDIWKALCRLCRDDDADHEVDMTVFRRKLRNIGALPEIIFEKEPLLKVSTIHKAKGREYDTVYIADIMPSPENLTEEEMRIRYVGFTRAKNKLFYGDPIKAREKAKKTATGRWVASISNRASRYDFCSGVVIGLNGDIDSTSFVSGDYDNAIAIQQYIAERVDQYDPLKIRMFDGKYIVFHEGRPIGALSSGMTEEFQAAVNATRYNRNIPTAFKNIYVSKITTEVLNDHGSRIADEFVRSGICYGIEITGIAKIEWDKSKSTKGKQ